MEISTHVTDAVGEAVVGPAPVRLVDEMLYRPSNLPGVITTTQPTHHSDISWAWNQGSNWYHRTRTNTSYCVSRAEKLLMTPEWQQFLAPYETLQMYWLVDADEGKPLGERGQQPDCARSNVGLVWEDYSDTRTSLIIRLPNSHKWIKVKGLPGTKTSTGVAAMNWCFEHPGEMLVEAIRGIYLLRYNPEEKRLEVSESFRGWIPATQQPWKHIWRMGCPIVEIKNLQYPRQIANRKTIPAKQRELMFAYENLYHLAHDFQQLIEQDWDDWSTTDNATKNRIRMKMRSMNMLKHVEE